LFFPSQARKDAKISPVSLDRAASGFSRSPSKPPFRWLHNTKEKNMSKPSHIAYVVNKATKNGKEQSFWRAVGAVWPHNSSGALPPGQFPFAGSDLD
jgi:hypothetical protein